MRYIAWARIRAGRLLSVLLALVIYFLLLSTQALYFFPHRVTDLFSLLLWLLSFCGIVVPGCRRFGLALCTQSSCGFTPFLLFFHYDGHVRCRNGCCLK